ncbi:hypothetical protein [Streptomyces sp. NPDC101776]|uniref:hypothetical protein n=1 Tax=Streptomyces sp. NPDC101776 TaxID=3366146 RepID=UPI003816C372
MRRRTFVTALGATVAASAVPGVARAATPLIAPTLTGAPDDDHRSTRRDPAGVVQRELRGTAAGSNALTRSPWVIWSTTDQVDMGGSGTGFGQNFGWRSVHAH